MVDLRCHSFNFTSHLWRNPRPVIDVSSRSNDKVQKHMLAIWYKTNAEKEIVTSDRTKEWLFSKTLAWKSPSVAKTISGITAANARVLWAGSPSNGGGQDANQQPCEIHSNVFWPKSDFFAINPPNLKYQRCHKRIEFSHARNIMRSMARH